MTLSIKNNNKLTLKASAFNPAFTFIEVLVALAVVSISLLPLLRLNIISINMFYKAQIRSQAVFLANAKIAESLVNGYPRQGTKSGTVENNGLKFTWQTEVKPTRLDLSEEKTVSGLREIAVDINWKQGIKHNHLRMSTCVADRKLP